MMHKSNAEDVDTGCFKPLRFFKVMGFHHKILTSLLSLKIRYSLLVDPPIVSCIHTAISFFLCSIKI
ncbi:hypothetical protein CW304_21250 [Bacillus sp. UFRGS-B20]|nr:hypothetical protein CW304_21250 [Bacillus sp. UFRGS-B20]